MLDAHRGQPLPPLDLAIVYCSAWATQYGVEPAEALVGHSTVLPG
jgi:hypothetical protein